MPTQPALKCFAPLWLYLYMLQRHDCHMRNMSSYMVLCWNFALGFRFVACSLTSAYGRVSLQRRWVSSGKHLSLRQA